MQTPLPLPFSAARSVKTAGEGRLHLKMAAPGTDWARRGAESAVVSVYLNGTHTADLVLHGGASWTDYTVALGPLGTGLAQVEIRFRPDLSPRGATEVFVDNAWLDTIAPTHPDYLLWRYAPRLYGRPDNASSDTPLLLLSRVQSEGNYQRLAYAFVWSDQDQGDDAVTRLALGGTTTDIDWVYELFVDRRTGAVPKAVVQGAGTLTDPLRGSLQKGHPVLRTVTKNNMVSPEGTSPLLFALPIAAGYTEQQAAREQVLDLYPWAVALSAKELARQGQPLDPRDYLYIDFNASLPLGGLLAAEVTLRNGRVLTSDQGIVERMISRSGWGRTAIALPSGTTTQQLGPVRLVRRDNKPAPHTAQLTRIQRLDSNYQPSSSY